MLASFSPTDHKKWGLDGARTDGCSCCSATLNMTSEKTDIMKEAKKNIKIAKKVCRYYKKDFNKFAGVKK